MCLFDCLLFITYVTVYFVIVCVCVVACLCACVRLCIHVLLRVCVLLYHILYLTLDTCVWCSVCMSLDYLCMLSCLIFLTVYVRMNVCNIFHVLLF